MCNLHLLLSNLWKNSAQRQIFSSSGSLFQFEKNMSFDFFYKKASALQYKLAMANYMTAFGNEENSTRSSRVMRRHRIDRLNMMPWHLKQVAKHYYWRGVFKMRCSGACLRETVKITWNHLWPRVYSVFSETLPYRPWFYTKKGGTLIYMTRHGYDKIYFYEPGQRLGLF